MPPLPAHFSLTLASYGLKRASRLFYVKTARRRALRTHIISGCLEIIACVCAFYSENPTKYAYAAAAFGTLAHVPSTFYQIPTVLGIKAFLVPSLGMVTALRAYFAVNLVLNPTSFYYLLSTYLTVHIHAWSRVFFALCLKDTVSRFSAAMLTNGTLLVPSVLGLSGNIILFVFVLTFDGILLMKTTSEFWKAWTTEHPRELAADPKKRVVLEALVTAAEVATAVESLSLYDTKDRYSRICTTVMTANACNTTPREKAHVVFRAIDVNKNNEISITEFNDFLIACGILPYGTEGKHLLDGLFQDRNVATADDFCAWFTKGWIHSSSITVPQLPRTPRGQAKLVFDALDADGSGELDLVELETLLTSWGLPRDEAKGYLKSHDKDQTGTIEFQEFYNSMGTVGKFAIQSFFDEGKIRTEE
ncbi:hypothetical protein BGZ95_000988 [Linnemannia exigua]|uniref:EF-hand domain-containing protein n=1 Tax=Linnemannia exigua TaxID=604196 RepID=A0AAD4H589_9FUNG|nr:hypothetical protein BGZ95_000988 [Linnemannia exigua]